MSTATQIRTTDHAVTDVVYQEDIVRSPMLRKLLAVGRIVIGWTFMWAFLDKVFGLGFATPAERAWTEGGSPTTGSGPDHPSTQAGRRSGRVHHHL